MEVWKDIKDYEEVYQVSNLGSVKSLYRFVQNKNGYREVKERILKQSKSKNGYSIVRLNIKNNAKTFQVHQLVAVAFLKHTRCGLSLVVDHIDDNKLNNKLSNLQILTNRENSIKKPRGISKYVGIYYNKSWGKWISRIFIDGKRHQLGAFNNEYDAHLAYQKELNLITNK